MSRKDTREVVPPIETFGYSYLEVVDTEIDSAIDELNTKGAEGWLVNTLVHSGGHYRFLLMKRTS